MASVDLRNGSKKPRSLHGNAEDLKSIDSKPIKLMCDVTVSTEELLE